MSQRVTSLSLRAQGLNPSPNRAVHSIPPPLRDVTVSQDHVVLRPVLISLTLTLCPFLPPSLALSFSLSLFRSISLPLPVSLSAPRVYNEPATAPSCPRHPYPSPRCPVCLSLHPRAPVPRRTPTRLTPPSPELERTVKPPAADSCWSRRRMCAGEEQPISSNAQPAQPRHHQ